MSRVVVVGGGIAGLVSAYRLVKSGALVTLYEAAPVVGGMVARTDLNDVEVDAGAEAYAIRDGVARALCAELGLEVAKPLGQSHLWWPDGCYPMGRGPLGLPDGPEDPALASLSAAGRQAVVAEASLDPAVGATAHSVGDFVRARLGVEVLHRLIEPVTMGIYGSPAERLAVEALAPGLTAGLLSEGSLTAAARVLRSRSAASVEQPVGGMFRLVNALSAAIIAGGGQILTGTPVTALHRTLHSLAVEGRDATLAQTNRVVLAVPASVAVALLSHLTHGLQAPPVRTTRQVLVAADSKELAADPVGSGVLVAEQHGELRAKALTHYSAKWPWARATGREVLRLSYPQHVFPTRAEVLHDIALLTGVGLPDSAVTSLKSISWDALPTRIDPPHRDHLIEVAAGVGVDLVGAWLDGNGVAPVVAGTLRVLR